MEFLWWRSLKVISAANFTVSQTYTTATLFSGPEERGSLRLSNQMKKFIQVFGAESWNSWSLQSLWVSILNLQSTMNCTYVALELQPVWTTTTHSTSYSPFFLSWRSNKTKLIKSKPLISLKCSWWEKQNLLVLNLVSCLETLHYVDM